MKNSPFFSLLFIYAAIFLNACGPAAEEQLKEQKKKFCVPLKFYGREFVDEDQLELSSGEFIICGEIDSLREDNRSVLEQLNSMTREIKTEMATLVKLDVEGNVIWEKNFPADGLASSFRQLIPGENNSFYALKANYVNFTVDGGFEIMQFDSSGKVLKDLKIHPKEHFAADKMIRIPGGDFILVGERHGEMKAGASPSFWDVENPSKSATLDQADFSHSYLARIEADGTIKWEKEYDKYYQFEEIANGSSSVFYIAGNKRAVDKYFICGADLATGTLLWEKELPRLHNFIYPMTSMKNGCAAIFVNSFGSKDIEEEAVLLVYDPSGNEKLKKSISIVPGFYFSTALNNDSAIVFSGYSSFEGDNAISYGLIDVNGTVIKKNTVHQRSSSTSASAIQLRSGRFFIIENEYDMHSNANIEYVMVTDERGDLPPSRDSI
jgi:hypothetical protein